MNANARPLSSDYDGQPARRGTYPVCHVVSICIIILTVLGVALSASDHVSNRLVWTVSELALRKPTVAAVRRVPYERISDDPVPIYVAQGWYHTGATDIAEDAQERFIAPRRETSAEVC